MILLRECKQAGEIVPLSWDFTAELETGETIATETVTALDLTLGTAAPTFLAGGAVRAGAVVSQKVTGGIVGHVYTVQCVIETSAGLTYVHEHEVHVVEE